MLYLILIDFANKQLKKTMMKKLLLLSMGAVMALQASAQDVRRLTTNLMDSPKQNSESVVKRNPNIKTTANSVLTVTPIEIGSAGNAFTQIGLNRRRVSVDQDLNTVLFTHRGDGAIAGGSSSKIMFDISTDGGANWTSNLGPVIGLDTNGLRARYPNGAIMNPTAGNTNAANARVIAMAPATDGNNWVGLMQGTCKLDGTGEVRTYFNSGNSSLPQSFTKRVNGEFWASDDYTTDSNIVLYKGVYSALGDSMTWSIGKTLGKFDDLFDTSIDTATHYLDVLIAFDKTGDKGWVAVSGELKAVAPLVADTAFNPIFWKTTDGGATWTGPEKVNLATMSNVMADPNLGGLKPSMGFNTGLAVDKNGNPHFFGVVCPASSSTPYSLLTGSPLSMYDVTINGQGNWVANYVDTVSTFRGTIAGFTSTGSLAVLHDNDCAVSVSTDGEAILYSWTDTKPENQTTAGANDFPDLYVKGYYVTSGTMGTKINTTEGSSVESVAYLPASANEALVTSAGYVLSTVILVPTGTESVVVNFSYLDGIVYPKFTGVNNVKNTLFNVSNNYPNPFSGSTSFDMNLNASANVVVTITNLLGQQVKEAVNATYTAGAHTIKIDASNLNAGVYFYNVNAGGFVMTNKMIVK
jgi:hypothetical protein